MLILAEFGNIALPLILGILVGLLIGAFCVYLIPVFNFKKAQKRAAATTKEAERKADKRGKCGICSSFDRIYYRIAGEDAGCIWSKSISVFSQTDR